MKCSESWLYEWVEPKLSPEALSAALTMSGLEVEELNLTDKTLDISITPNRGDCLSIQGLAREVAAITGAKLTSPAMPAVTAAIDDVLPVNISAKAGCPHYAGRIIRGVKADLQSPEWLVERLRISDVKSISPIVDVTNFVMLELGQPMHAFDLDKINQGIDVRMAKKGEQLVLLDDSTKILDEQTLIIADKTNPLAIAGVMGGLDSGVTALTKDIFLESAYFTPEVVARQRQYYGLNSESSYRFERGIDYTIQQQAIERATQLILELCGGQAGPVIDVQSQEHLPATRMIELKPEKIKRLLGVDIPEANVKKILTSLGFICKDWKVTVPAYRSDVSIQEDLIEEIARLYGYDNIPEQKLKAELKSPPASNDLRGLRQAFCHQGFHEIISYSFIDKNLQAMFDPQETARELVNPITSDMSVMRTNLWPGLVNTLIYNKSRQQARVRLFEVGDCFITRDKKVLHEPRIAGLVSGYAMPEQWGVPSREVDFYDLKASIENILGQSFSANDIVFKATQHAALHPGQSAEILHKNNKIGCIGALHPSLLQALDISGKVFVFELDLKALQAPRPYQFSEISKFPEIRRDIAILVNQTVPAKAIQDTIKMTVGDWLKDVFIFDVYQGKGISPGYKSVAIALILQHPTRTLVDDEVAKLMTSVVSALQGQLGAELRS